MSAASLQALQLATSSSSLSSTNRQQQNVEQVTATNNRLHLAPAPERNSSSSSENGSSNSASRNDSGRAATSAAAANQQRGDSGNTPAAASTVKKNSKPCETIFDADFTVYARDALHYGENFNFDKTYSNIPTRNFGKLTWRVQCTRTWTKQNGISLTLSLLEHSHGTSCGDDEDESSATSGATTNGLSAPLKISVRIELEQIVPDYCYNERLKLTYLFTPGECMTLGPLKLVSEPEIEALHNADFSRFKSPQSWECPKCHQWQDSLKCNDCYAECVYYCFFCREGRAFISTSSASPSENKSNSSRTTSGLSVSSSDSLLSALKQRPNDGNLSTDDELPNNHHKHRAGSVTAGKRSGANGSGEQQHAQRCPECNAFCINSLRFTFLNPHGNLRCWIKVDGEKQQQLLIDDTNKIVLTRATPEIADTVQTWLSRDTELMQRLADCYVEAEGQKISAHMAILASRSRYFQALINAHKKALSSSGSILQPLIWSLPCSLAVAEMILYHLYTDQMPLVPNNNLTLIYELLRMTDLFEMTRLKNQCEAELYQLINKTNACEMLLAADAANAEQIRDYAINYAQWNLKFVMQSPQWQELCYPENSHLVHMITTGKRPTPQDTQSPIPLRMFPVSTVSHISGKKDSPKTSRTLRKAVSDDACQRQRRNRLTSMHNG